MLIHLTLVTPRIHVRAESCVPCPETDSPFPRLDALEQSLRYQIQAVIHFGQSFHLVWQGQGQAQS